MIGDGDMVLCAFQAGAKADVGCRFGGKVITADRGEASSRNDLILDHVKADDIGFVGGVEMTGDGITNHGF